MRKFELRRKNGLFITEQKMSNKRYYNIEETRKVACAICEKTKLKFGATSTKMEIVHKKVKKSYCKIGKCVVY